MRWPVPVLVCLVAIVSGAHAQVPAYTDDQQIEATLLERATQMHEQGRTVPNQTLQDQLVERKRYNAPAPQLWKLTPSDEGLFDAADDGVLIVAGCYLCGRCNKLHINHASGFVLTADGLAVTNYHVVRSKENLTLVAMTRDMRVVPVTEVLAANESDDVALIRLGGKDFTPLPLARSAKVGERVHAITHPDGRFYHYARGEISRFFLARNGPDRPAIRRIGITAEYAKGSSGGPILNDAGQVVAMVCSTSSVYYNKKSGQQLNLQMVFRDCVPYQSILDLFSPDGQPAQAR